MNRNVLTTEGTEGVQEKRLYQCVFCSNAAEMYGLPPPEEKLAAVQQAVDESGDLVVYAGRG